MSPELQEQTCDIGAYEANPTQLGPSFIVKHECRYERWLCDLLGSGIGNQDCTLREAINGRQRPTGTRIPSRLPQVSPGDHYAWIHVTSHSDELTWMAPRWHPRSPSAANNSVK